MNATMANRRIKLNKNKNNKENQNVAIDSLSVVTFNNETIIDGRVMRMNTIYLLANTCNLVIIEEFWLRKQVLINTFTITVSLVELQHVNILSILLVYKLSKIIFTCKSRATFIFGTKG